MILTSPIAAINSETFRRYIVKIKYTERATFITRAALRNAFLKIVKP